MTKTELHQVQGFHPDTLRATGIHLRATIPSEAGSADATSIINHEGWMRGYLAAIKAMEQSAIPEAPKSQKPPAAPYSQPAEQNQNRP